MVGGHVESKNSRVDPVDVMEKFGSDSLRFDLAPHRHTPRCADAGGLNARIARRNSSRRQTASARVSSA